MKGCCITAYSMLSVKALMNVWVPATGSLQVTDDWQGRMSTDETYLSHGRAMGNM